MPAPVQLIVAAFSDEEGKLRITNAKHRDRRGLLTGGAISGTLALLSGPLGAVIGKVRNVPFKASVEDLASSLTPGSSMLVALVEHRWVEQLEAIVVELGAQVPREELKADIAEHADGNAEVSGLLVSGDGILLTEAELTAEELPPAPEGTEDESAEAR